MPVPATINDLALTAIANSPQGTESAKGTIDEYFRAQAGFIAELRDGAVMKFTQTGVGAVTSTVLSKLRALDISPDDFGATGTSVFPGDTVAVQRALDDGRPVKFTRDYYVDSVTISGIGRTVNFNNYTLNGCSTGTPDYLLSITGRELKLYGISLDAKFKTYSSALRWYSLSSGAPSQYNKIFGLHIANATVGVTYGQAIGSASTDAAQSENVIYSYTTRAVQKPWIGNQSNGYMTLVAPVLDCNPNEWATQPGYVAATWQTAAVGLHNALGSLIILGGEVLKTSSQLGYGIRGNSVTMIAPTIEIASIQGYIDGNFTIKDNLNGGQSSDSVPAFEIAAGATGTFTLQNPSFSRAAGVGAYSGARFISDSTAAAGFKTTISGGNIVEWPFPLGAARTEYRDINLTETAALGSIMLGNSNENLLATKGADVMGYTTTGWYLTTYYGGGTTMTVAAAGPSSYLAKSLQLHATGEAQVTTTDETSAASIIATSLRVRPGELYRLSVQANRSAGTNARVIANFYTAAGVAVGSAVPIIDAATMSLLSFSLVGGTLRVPANAAYMGIGVYNNVADIQITDIKLIRA